MPNIADQMMQIVTGIAKAPDPRMANRQRLADVVADLSLFEVLSLPPHPFPDETGLRGSPGIIGELKQRIPEIARKHKTLRDHFFSAGGVENLSPNDLQDGVTLRRYVLHGWSKMHQRLRMAWNDYSPDPRADWYRPLVANSCAFTEHHVRQLLGMEPVLGRSGPGADIEALARSSFMNIVLSGVVDPLQRQQYKCWNLEVSEVGDRPFHFRKH